jgi:NAD(P)-dependent dehydrogenase (short-subunit alcohol dehydrogenase family)
MSMISRLVLLAAVVAVYFVAAPQSHADQHEKAVLVTGASSGIGLAIAKDLAANGFFVYAGARKAEDLAALNKIENVQSVRLDVTVQEDIDSALQTVIDGGRGLFGVVNNAGVGVLATATEMPEKDLHFTFNVNVLGPYRVTKAFAPLIIESQGRITTIGSISGILSGRTSASYSMSKHAVEAYTDSLALEMADHGVAVSVVEPGNYQSRIRHKVVEDAKAKGVSGEQLEGLEEWANTEWKDPIEVAIAVRQFLVEENPGRRYMVVPVADEAEVTIRKIIMEMVELNQNQAFKYDRDELVKMVDEALASLESSAESD